MAVPQTKIPTKSIAVFNGQKERSYSKLASVIFSMRTQ